jgi:hypothetical protein
MAIYLLNLGYSMNPSSSTAYVDGNFEPNQSSVTTPLGQSCAWYEYTGSGFNPVLQDKPYFINQPLTPSEWACLGDDDQFELSAIAGDFVLVRIFSVDTPPPTGCKARISAVFGRGRDKSHDHVNDRQSPLQVTNGDWKTARAVVDSDDSSHLSWRPGDSDAAAWTYCLGMLHNPKGETRRYSMSVGGTIYRPNPAPAAPMIGIYGHDPTMKVGGGGPLEDVAAA